MRKFLSILSAIAIAIVGAVAFSSPASAIHNGQKWINSSASDFPMIVYPNGKSARGYRIDPGASYTLNSGNYSPANIVIEIGTSGTGAESFRIRKNATSGPYEGCQNAPKTFRPGDSNVIYFLNYYYDDCEH